MWVQAVGRAMRTAPDKELGYIVCPILIPPTADPEKWLSNSDSEEGWQELGQILRALRSHDQRIEENLEELLHLYVPKPPPLERTIVAVATSEGKRIQYGEVIGPPGAAQEAVERALEGKTRAEAGIQRISESPTEHTEAEQTHVFTMEKNEDGSVEFHLEPANAVEPVAGETHDAEQSLEVRSPIESGIPSIDETTADYRVELTQVLTGKKNADGSVELRADSVVRDKPKVGEARGVVNIRKTKAKTRKMINTGEGGIRVQKGSHRKPRKTAKERAEEEGQLMLRLSGLEEHGSAIKMNLLTKSGLSDNRVMRDLNILESSVSEAAHHMRADGLLPSLNRHFGLDRLKETGKEAG